MKCPTCRDVTLTMTERQGIEIDYCPECRGVWLDRGELDKLIEKSTTQQAAPQEDGRKHRESKYEDRDYDKREYSYKKRKSFLSEIFD